MKLLRREDPSGGYWVFYCPGCQELHPFDKRWSFDGNLEAPTFLPSLRMGPYWRMPPGWDPEEAKARGESLENDPATGRLPGAVEWACHLFLRTGHLEFLSDCSHELAGKTVDLPELPDWAL